MIPCFEVAARGTTAKRQTETSKRWTGYRKQLVCQPIQSYWHTDGPRASIYLTMIRRSCSTLKPTMTWPHRGISADFYTKATRWGGHSKFKKKSPHSEIHLWNVCTHRHMWTVASVSTKHQFSFKTFPLERTTATNQSMNNLYGFGCSVALDL